MGSSACHLHSLVGPIVGPSSGSPVTFNSTDLPAQVPHFNLHDSTIRLSGQRRSLAKPSSGTAEASRECLALIVVRQPRHEDVLAALVELFIARRPPANIRSDNGREFIATAVQKWLAQIGVSTLYIAFGSPLKRRLQRKLKRVASRRTAQRADFLLPRRGQGADQSLAASLQPSARTAASATDRRPHKPFHRQCRPPVPRRFTHSQNRRWRQSCINNQAKLLAGG